VSTPTLTAEAVSGGAVEITHPRDLNFASIEARNAFKSSVLRALAIIMFQIVAIPDAAWARKGRSVAHWIFRTLPSV
jgi:hypothetical protein